MTIQANGSARAARRARSTWHWRRRLVLEDLEPRLLLALTPINRPVPAVEGTLFDNGIAFSFTDTVRNDTASDFEASISWGDGTPITAGTVVANGTGGFDVHGSHTYAEEGSYVVAVTVTDVLTGATVPSVSQASHVTMEPLVSDVSSITADNHDPNLINPWGIAFDAGGIVGVNDSFEAGGPFWVADNGSDVSTLYDGAGVPQPLVVSTPDLPTGVVFNPTSDFSVNGLPTPFLFADQEGQIAGWNWSAASGFGSTTVAATGPEDANFTGLAMATDSEGQNFLYAANFDFHQKPFGTVDRFSSSFGELPFLVDQNIPFPFEPYNVQNIGGDLYVSYAQPDASGLDAQPSGGFIDVFSPDGMLLRELVVEGALSAPWGMVQAPSNFGAFSNDLLVANHGNGRIGAYNITTGAFLGSLTDASGKVVIIDGLKGLSFGNGADGGLSDTLYYTAGTNDGADGTMGSLSLTSYGVVADAPLQSSPDQPVAAVEGQTFTSELSTLTDTDPEGTVSDYVAVIDWGDGSDPTPGVITYDGSPKYPTFDVSGTHTYLEFGDYNYTVTVYDVGGSVTQTSGVVVVADAPLAIVWDSPPVDSTLTEGDPISDDDPTDEVAEFKDGNPFATASDFSVSIEWGDGTVSPGAVDALAPGLFGVDADHTYSEEGTYMAQITVADVGGSTASAIGQMNVVDAPLTGTSLDISATEGQPLSDVTVLTFTDANPMALVSDFFATINWGDGDTSQGTVVPVGGATDGADFKVVGDHTYVDEGTYTLTVTVADKGGATLAPTPSTATVADAPLNDIETGPIVATEGISLPPGAVVARFQDANPLATVADFTTAPGSVMVDYGDGTGPVPATVTALGGGSFSVTNTLSVIYPDEGTFPIIVTIMDDGGSSAVLTNVAYVADAALIAKSAPTITTMEGTPLTNVTVATFTDLNPTATPADFPGNDVDIDWGDGTHTDGTVSLANFVFTVTGSHTYTEVNSPGTSPPPPFTITVTIHDDGGSVAAATTLAMVSDAILTQPGVINVQAVEGQYLSNVPLATLVDINHFGGVNDFDATIDWGDGTPIDQNAVVTQIGASSGGTHYEFSGSHTYAEEGSYTITVKVFDIDNPANIMMMVPVATVADAPLTAIDTGPLIATEGTPIPKNTVVARFQDGNPAAPVADFATTISFGVGAPVAGTVVALGGGSFNVQTAAAFTYPEEGNFLTQVNVTDKGGSKAVLTNQAIVADAQLTNITPIGFKIAGFVGKVLAAAGGGGSVTAIFQDGNPTPPMSDFTAIVDWADGNTSLASIIATGVPNIFKVASAHVYTSVGVHFAYTTIKDAGGSSLVVDPEVDIADDALSAVSGPVDLTAVENQPFTGEVATFTYDNPIANASEVEAKIDWGDGTSSVGVINQDSSGVYHVVGTHTFADESSSQPLTVTIQDFGSLVPISGLTHDPITISGTMTVAAAEITVIGATDYLPEGITGNQVVGTFTDANPLASLSEFTATVEPDSSLMEVSNISISQPGGTGTPFVVNADIEGDDDDLGNLEQDGSGFLLTVTGAGGSVGAAPGQFNWFDPVLVDPGIKVQAVADSAFQGKIASFTTTDPRATTADFTAVVNWGDGHTSTAAVASNPAGGFFVLGDHTYAQSGTFTVVTTISDDQGHSVADSTTASVGMPLASHGLKVSAVAGKRFAGALTTLTAPDRSAAASALSALINWGDGTDSRGVVRTAGKSKKGEIFKVDGSHVYAHRGRFVGSVAIVENGGAQVLVPIVVNVRGGDSGAPRMVAVLGSSHPQGPRESVKPDRRVVRVSVAQPIVARTIHRTAMPMTLDRKSSRVS
jgi:large repetitive protein